MLQREVVALPPATGGQFARNERHRRFASD